LNAWKYGYLTEGVLEQAPLSDDFVIRTVDADGRPLTFSVNDALRSLVGQEVRFTLASFEDLAKLAELVEGLGGSDVQGYYVKKPV